MQQPGNELTSASDVFGMPSKIATYTVPAMPIEHHVYFTGAIEEPGDYTDLLNLLDTAREGMQVHIHINSPGGNVMAGMQILNAMENSEATVITHLDGEASSMAAIILLNGDQIAIKRHGTIMIHSYSSMVYGKRHELHDYINSCETFNTDFLDSVRGFLTKKEIKQVINGRDVYFSAKEAWPRIERLMKRRHKQYEKEHLLMMKEMEAAAAEALVEHKEPSKKKKK